MFFDLLPTVCGVVLLLVVAYDVYATILHARARSGPVSESLNRTVWNAARFVAFKLTRARRHHLLNAVGPLLLPSLIVVYIVLLVCAFALIYFPRMPAQFTTSAQETGLPWMEALYFSGTTLTTLGYGDIAPRTVEMRLVAMAEAATGFALISLAVTYLLSVYGALERKRAVALSFYHQAEQGANVAGFITHHFVRGNFYGLDAALRTATRDLQGLLESHIEHPVIYYFHPGEVHKGMPRMLFLELETCAVIGSCLDEEEYAELCHHPEVRTLGATARHVLRELVRALDIERRSSLRGEITHEEQTRWGHRYRRTLKQLKAAGVRTVRDEEAGLAAYCEQRDEWDAQLRRFSSFSGYDWDEVTGDTDLRYAADEEMEEPAQTQTNAER
ncbi:MAG TPA: ion channel [Pyrinomonadaceae bacterium]|nr:ion channel [Pyrinomonadaceae bacterium]